MKLLQAKLMFDSATAGASAGTRGVGGDVRSFLFRCGDIYVDMLAKVDGNGGGIIRGQVMIEMDCQAGRALEGSHVTLLRETATTDRHGEFALYSPDAGKAQEILVLTRESGIICKLPALN